MDSGPLKDSHTIYNCYNCKYLDLSTALIAHTRLDNKAKVNMVCTLKHENSEVEADYQFLMAECYGHPDHSGKPKTTQHK